jgi:uroporphyrinogen III methyltransferase/synthase
MSAGEGAGSGKPLEGKRIVVTRSVEQARDLVARLETMGAVVLLFPAVSFSEPPDTAGLDRAIRSLGEFDWTLFTSANAVKFFAARCRKLGVEPCHGGNCRCAAVGPATASAVAAAGFSVDHVAQEFLGVALAHELSASLAGKKILLPRSERARPDLPEALKSVGAEVTEVVAYHTGGVGAIDPEVMRAIREAQVDVISFFSPSAIENMRGELGEDSFARLGAKAAMAAVGPVTAGALREAGFRVAIEAPLATAESMAAAIVNYFSPTKDSKARAV